jgi:single-stranded DNA-specific DHH superfamily exonuclease
MKGNRKINIDSDEIGLKFIFDLPDPIIITHGDVDGLCAAALLVREFKQNKIEVPIFITQPFSLKHILKEIKNKEMKGHLIIVDLALSEKSIDYLPSGCVVIDHHPSTHEYSKLLKERGIHHLVDINISASQLVGRLVTETNFNNYLAKMGGVGDRIVFNKRMGRQSMKASSAMSLDPKDDEFRAFIIAELVGGKRLSEIKELNTKSKEAFHLLDEVKENGELLYDGEHIVVKFYENGFGRASVLASKLTVAMEKVAIVLTLMKGNTKQYLVTGRSPERDGVPVLDIRKFVSELKSGGDGGGLTKAASCTIKKSDIGDFIEQIEQNDKRIQEQNIAE